jgi:hypothetical protein
VSSYDGQDLFGSGPHRCSVAHRPGRVQVIDAPGVGGARLVHLGRGAKTLALTGRLTGADKAELLTRCAAIEAVMDGRAATLIEPDGTPHDHMVLTAFEPSERIDRGRVCSLTYRATFVEAG